MVFFNYNMVEKHYILEQTISYRRGRKHKMAVKKTELYRSLWASCDALRGGMDASQYKDYVLTLLFMKYVTDKYKGQKYADIKVFDKAHDTNRDPDKRTGCSFDDFIALKTKRTSGMEWIR